MSSSLLRLFNTTGVGADGALAAPANLALSITGASKDVITATWDAVSGASDYEVEYSDDGVTYAPVDTTALLTYGVTSADYVVGAVTHYVRVRATGGEDWAIATQKGRWLSALLRWSFDEASGVRVDSIGSADWDLTGIPATTGKLSNAVYTSGATNLHNTSTTWATTGATDAYTIAMWLKMDSGLTYAPPFRHWILGGAVALVIVGDNNDSTVNIGATGASSQPIALVPNTWGCIVFGGDGSGGAWWSFNGSAVAAFSGATLSNADAITITTTEGISHAFDEMVFINRKWSDAEVAEYYNAGTGVAYPN